MSDKTELKLQEVEPENVIPLEGNMLFQGDALSVLRRLPAGSFQTVVTSPPYWSLRDYNHKNQIGLEERLPQFINKLVQVFSEVKRVLAHDGVLWVNIGDGYTSGNRKWRAPDKKNRARAMSIRPATPTGLKPKDLMGIPWRLAFALQDDGWFLRSDVIWNKPNSMPESVRDRPNRSHEYLFMLSKNKVYSYDRLAVTEKNGRNMRSVWSVNTKPYAGAHFATFPPQLIEPCILSSSSRDQYVLDPFFGSGTVGEVSASNGRRFVGIELNSEYVALAARRMRSAEANFRTLVV